MKRIRIQNNEHCDVFTFEGIYTYNAFCFKEKGKEIWIECNHETYLLKDTLCIKDFIIVHIPKRIWSIIQCKEKMILGRKEDCDIQIMSKEVSNYHATFTKDGNHFIVKDLQSTNGVYVNRDLVKEKILQDGDSVWIARYQLVYINGYLLVSWKEKSIFMQTQPIVLDRKEMDIYTPSLLSYPIIRLESYAWDSPVMKPTLFQSIGSSVLILFSSLITCTILYFSNSYPTEQLITMFFTSGSMAIAFLIFGIYNRNANQKTSLKQIQEKEDKYFAYLDHLYKPIQQELLQYENQILIQEKEYTSFQHRFESLLIGYKMKSYVQFDYHNPPFQFMHSSMHNRILEWISKHEVQVKEPIFYDFNSNLCINEKDIEGFLFVLQLMHSSYKFVFVGKQFKESHFIHQASAREGNKRLWIFDEKSYHLVFRALKPHQLYCFLIQDESFVIPNTYRQIHFKQSDIQPVLYRFDYSTYQQFIYSNQTSSLIKEIYNPSISIEEYWNQPLSLKVCLGIDEKGNRIDLDLDEKKDGVHGLVAGTTGSGKSEFLSNILLQLVMKNSPKQFQFILVDFKGGAFGSVFETFPHFAGMMTNLDQDVQRFLASMKHFIEERQSILLAFQKERADVNAHIDVYNQYHKDGLSHVCIIVDEFAQLKEQAPDILLFLKQMARIGRSLGIHLILSTQKPLGVVDEQIWSNTSYHVCLKVSSIQDSREVIHNESAFDLKQPGQFILERNNEYIQGTSFYIQDCIEQFSYKEINEYDEILSSKEMPSQTILQMITQKISSLSFTSSYILLPPLSNYPFQNELGVYENRFLNKQIPFELDYGESILILTHRKDVSFPFILSSDSLIYTYNVYDQDAYVDESLFHTNYFSSLQSLHKSYTLIVHYQSLQKEYLLPFINQKHVRLIVYGDVRSIPYEFTYRCVYDWDGVEDKKNFFQSYKIMNQNLIQIKEDFYPICFNVKSPKKKKKKHLLKIQYDFLLGQENGQFVYWNQHRDLLIVYVQESKRRMIEQMIQKWSSTKRVRILNVLDHLSFFQSDEYMKNQYDWDVVWVGQGFMDYGFYIKRKGNGIHGDLWYWDEKECRTLEWVEYG